MIIEERNIILLKKNKKNILLDVFYPESNEPIPVIIFCHGYKGFKDWGNWSEMGKSFADAGFAYIQFNFSHNGTTENDPINFSDLESFGNNNYSIELDDLNRVVDYIFTRKEFDSNKIGLIAHSRGAGIAFIHSSIDKRIKALVSLAGVSDFDKRMKHGKALEDWKKEGVFHVKNARTNQEMPHYFQFYEDFDAHRNEYNIEIAAKNIEIPTLIIHAENDEAIAKNESENLNKWIKNSTLKIIENTAHTFGMKHPKENDFLPKPMETATNAAKDFFKTYLK